MTYLKVLIIVLTFSFSSCNTTNKAVDKTENTENNTIEMNIKEMASKGYLAGQISFSKVQGDCPITIKVEGENGTYYLDPIDLSEEFKNDGEQIWFKFGPLRRMNRCDKASPISIIEIIKRN